MPVNDYAHLVEHPDDWRFVNDIVHHAPESMLPALFCAYLASWRHGAMQEPAPQKKENAGRRAANTRLRVDAAKMQEGDPSTVKRYARLVKEGPKKGCATCQHCSLAGECGLSLPGPGPACPEWRADFT